MARTSYVLIWCVFYWTNILNLMFILHLTLRNYSPPVSNVAPLRHLTLTSSKPVCVLTPQCLVTSRKAANATFVCNDWLDRGANPRPNALEASMNTITPSRRSFMIKIVPVRLRWEFRILVCQNRPRVLLYVLITICHKHVKEWKASLQNFYDRHQELLYRYEISISQVAYGSFPFFADLSFPLYCERTFNGINYMNNTAVV